MPTRRFLVMPAPPAAPAAPRGVLRARQAQPTPPSQLTIDDSVAPAVDAPDFPGGRGALVLVDEAHRNVMSLATYFRPVGRWLERP